MAALADWSSHYGGGEFTNLKVFDEAMEAVYAKPHSAADYERMAQTMEYDSERAMFEAYSRNKYASTGVIQWMLNNAWPSMIWHLYDYYLDAGAGYFAAKKACEPLHIQYSYDDRSIVVVNSTYASVRDFMPASTSTTSLEGALQRPGSCRRGPDSSQRVFTDPARPLSQAPSGFFFIDLTLTDAAGKVVSRNFYWVPGTLTTFDWPKTDYTHTPAARHEDLTALTHPAAGQSRMPAPRSKPPPAAANSACISTTPQRLGLSDPRRRSAHPPAGSSRPSSGPTTGSS